MSLDDGFWKVTKIRSLLKSNQLIIIMLIFIWNWHLFKFLVFYLMISDQTIWIIINKHFFFQNMCPEIMQTFWISDESVAHLWCNLAINQGPYSACINRHSPVAWLSQWGDAIEWVCVLWDLHISHDNAPVLWKIFWQNNT